MRPRFVAILTATVLAVAAAPGAVSASASASPSSFLAQEPVPAGFSSWEELFAVQARMNAAAEEIRAIAGADRGSGLGSIVAAPESGKLVIYWRGPVPPSVRSVIDKHLNNVAIVVEPARYSLRQLNAEAERLSKYPGILEVGPLPDAAGVSVTPRDIKTATAITAETYGAAVHVELSREPGGGREFASRQNDSTPHYAGALTTADGEWQCTTGFAIYHNGQSKLLYAAHCAVWSEPVTDGGGEVIGGAYFHNYTRDTAMIQGSAYGRMWDGAYQSEYWKAVQGATFSNVGNWLCTSGAVSGVRCGIQVISNNQWVDGDGPFVGAKKIDGTNAVGKGDSGGPVFELPSPNNGKVIAKGIMSAGMPMHETTCTGMPVSRPCYSRLWYADVTQTLSAYGATLLTS